MTRTSNSIGRDDNDVHFVINQYTFL